MPPLRLVGVNQDHLMSMKYNPLHNRYDERTITPYKTAGMPPSTA